MACFHIIIRHASMRTGPALKRCYRTRKTAEAVQGQRGATGDRADYNLDPGQALGVVACYDKLRTASAPKWPQGHNADSHPRQTSSEPDYVRTLQPRSPQRG